MGQALAPIGFEIPPGMTEGTWRSAGYEPSGGRATAAKVLLGISTAVDGLLALWLISGLSLITRIMDGAATQAEVTSYDNTQTGLSSGSLLGYVVAGIAVLFWLARVVSNVPWLGGGTPQHSPGWSVGVWFIPVVFLVVPYVVVRNLWRRLVSPGRSAAAAVVAAWWLTFLAGAILTRFAAASLSAAETESALRGAVYAGILGSSLTVVSGILLIRIIGELETRCRVRATALGVVPTPPGSDGFAQSWIGVRMRYPSVLGLIVGWVIAVCTVVGYPFAVYMTWRFATGYRDASPGTGPRASAATRPAETPLSSGSTRERLAELSDMRAAGLISDEEWATLRSAALGLPPPGQT